MTALIPTRTKCWGSVAAVLAGAAAGSASPPEPAPRHHTSTIEVYVGTTKVVPPPVAGPRDVPKAEADAAPAAREPVLPASAWTPSRTESAQPTVVVIRESERPAPAPMPPAPQQPTVVVVREGEPRAAVAAPEPAARPATDWLLLGVGVAGGLAVALVARNRTAPAPAAPPSAEPPAPVAEKPPEVVRLSGGYEVGPLPNTVQKFDMGPSYQEERKVKEQEEEAKGAAVLEFILGENLALRDAIDAEPQAAPVPEPPAETKPPAPPKPKPVPDFLTGVLVPFPS